MLAVIKSYALEGIDGYPIDIEIDARSGMPAFDIVGLPNSAIKESRNRVRSAITNSCFEFIPKRITVNLAPADIKKEGSLYDFPIAIGFLAATEQISTERLNEFIMFGELSLDGSLRRVNGVLPILISALSGGYKKFIIPYDNAAEAGYVAGTEIYAVKTLSEAAAFLGGIINIKPICESCFSKPRRTGSYGIDMSDVKGQYSSKRGIEIAVTGGHNVLMCGSPGVGKTMLAKCIPTIMPDMTFEEMIETTKIHSVAGLIDSETGIVAERPFRSPHHTASIFSLTGGGAKSLPGEVSLAHNGVLFLDELPEYSKKTLETLRQPIEDGVITVARVAKTVQYPADFILCASMNPCPCGYAGSKTRECSCTEADKKRYKSRISGPLLDRIDIYTSVEDVEYAELTGSAVSETSAEIKKRVTAARNLQSKRFEGEGIYTNSQMTSTHINKYCKLDSACLSILENSYRRFSLSARGATRIIKVARTIADLRGGIDIAVSDIIEAIQYRVRGISDR